MCDSLNGASLHVRCWWFLEQREGPRSHRASGPRLHKKEKDIWQPFWWDSECQHEHIRRGTNCSQPQSNTERMTTKIETFRWASPFALHSVLCCSERFPFPDASALRSETDPYWIMNETLHNRVAQPLSNPLWSAQRGWLIFTLERLRMIWWLACCHCSPIDPETLWFLLVHPIPPPRSFTDIPQLLGTQFFSQSRHLILILHNSSNRKVTVCLQFLKPYNSCCWTLFCWLGLSWENNVIRVLLSTFSMGTCRHYFKGIVCGLNFAMYVKIVSIKYYCLL